MPQVSPPCNSCGTALNIELQDLNIARCDFGKAQLLSLQTFKLKREAGLLSQNTRNAWLLAATFNHLLVYRHWCSLCTRLQIADQAQTSAKGNCFLRMRLC